MEKASTIIVADDGDQLKRDIIKTHLYYLQNLSVLNSQERGYFYNEYFPAVRDYLIIEPDVLVPSGLPLEI